MLLTITYRIPDGDAGHSARDLSWLLHKNPSRLHEFSLPMGKAYVCYPERSDERTTAALLLDLDPLDIARGKPGADTGSSRIMSMTVPMRHLRF